MRVPIGTCYNHRYVPGAIDSSKVIVHAKSLWLVAEIVFDGLIMLTQIVIRVIESDHAVGSDYRALLSTTCSYDGFILARTMRTLGTLGHWRPATIRRKCTRKRAVEPNDFVAPTSRSAADSLIKAYGAMFASNDPGHLGGCTEEYV